MQQVHSVHEQLPAWVRLCLWGAVVNALLGLANAIAGDGVASLVGGATAAFLFAVYAVKHSILSKVPHR